MSGPIWPVNEFAAPNLSVGHIQSIAVQIASIKPQPIAADVITAFATVGLFVLAWVQLRAIRATAQADFIHRLSVDYFTDESARIRTWLLHGGLAMASRNGQYEFCLDEKVLFTEDQLENSVLGPLEVLGTFEKRPALDFESVYDVFASTIIEVWPNPVIRELVKQTRSKPHSSDVYERLEHLYVECCSFEKEKARGPWHAWWWKRCYGVRRHASSGHIVVSKRKS